MTAATLCWSREVGFDLLVGLPQGFHCRESDDGLVERGLRLNPRLRSGRKDCRRGRFQVDPRWLGR
jgi:hypothetical protein